MLISPKRISKNQNGSITLALIGVTIISGIIYVVMNLQNLNVKSVKIAEANLDQQTNLYFAQDALYYAYRLQEMKYYAAVKNCVTFNSFITALKNGAGCNVNVVVFKSEPLIDGSQNNTLYELLGPGCEIKENNSTCANIPRKILTVENQSSSLIKLSPFGSLVYEFSIANLLPDKNTIEFTALIKEKNKSHFSVATKRTFALKELPRNFVHVKKASSENGQIDQENPSPFSRCPATPWGMLLQFNPDTLQCQQFPIMAGMLGLAYYQGKFFGFKKVGGQVFDLLASINSSEGNFSVDETGRLNGMQVFPTFDRELIEHGEDITIIGETIYLVTPLPNVIQVMDMRPPPNIPSLRPICNIEVDDGLGMKVVGLASGPMSEDLLDMQEGKRAIFYVKFKGGILFTVFAVIVKDGLGNLKYECTSYRENNIDQESYSTHWGFDRTDDDNFFINY